MLSDEYLAKRAKKEFSKMKQQEAVTVNDDYRDMISQIGQNLVGVARLIFLELNGNLLCLRRMNPMLLRCQEVRWA